MLIIFYIIQNSKHTNKIKLKTTKIALISETVSDRAKRTKFWDNVFGRQTFAVWGEINEKIV